MNLQEQISRMKSMMGMNEQNEKKNPLPFLEKGYWDYNPVKKNKIPIKNISGYDVSKIEIKEKPTVIGQYPTSFVLKSGSDHMRKEIKTIAILYEGFIYCMIENATGGNIIYKFNKNDFENSLKNNTDSPSALESFLTTNEKNQNFEKYKKIQELINQANLKLKDEVSYELNNLPKLELSLMQDKVFILNFWATWCRACKSEITNLLIPLHQEFGKKGLDFFFYSLDNNPMSLKNFIDKNINFGVHVFDNLAWKSEALKTYNVTSLPSTFLFDKSGNMVNLTHDLEEAKKIIFKKLFI